MKAVGFYSSLPINSPEALVEAEIEKPIPGDNELLVQVKAAGLNPVDYKVRQRKQPEKGSPLTVVGWDAAGIIEAVGKNISNFQIGDEVYYSGDVTKTGCNAEYQLIDEAIVAKKPKSFSWEESCVLPLVGLTAWEALFDRLGLQQQGEEGRSILIINGAGGVGSVAIQFLKELTKIKVVATASRPDSQSWCRELGADEVINHRTLTKDSLPNEFDYIFCLYDTSVYWESMANWIKPQGKICSIVKSEGKKIDLDILQIKSTTFCWELMFTRSFFQTEDKIKQGQILAHLADLVDNGKIKNILKESLVGLSAETFIEAHKRLESQQLVGKLAIKY